MCKAITKRPTETSSYVLLTAAHNEEAHIEKTIACVVAQTLLPKQWVIVSDSSIDRTDEIVEKYAQKHRFIRFLRINRPAGRSFAFKVLALRSGQDLLSDVDFDFIGNLDADITLERTYFNDLIRRFHRSAALGLAGGFVYEEAHGEFRCRKLNNVDSIPHAAQLLRRKCYETIGGYAVLKYGGEDWHAQLSVTMNGWQARAFPDLRIFHHRRFGDTGHRLQHWFREGRMDYSFGSYPIFEILKCSSRVLRSRTIGGIVRLLGFLWCYVCREDRLISSRIRTFLRSQQRRRISSFYRRALNRKSNARNVSANVKELLNE